ncbi:MAG: CinA family protein [Desulfobacteraceae bacterium]|nr:CinA family protein [Desulfobacteraceae bacterium]
MSFINLELRGLVEQIAKILIQKKETVSVAESTAGGLVAASLLSYPGASTYFIGGSVLYSYSIRKNIVCMGPDEHSVYPGATPELMLEIARQFQKRTLTTWVLSEGGAAGPTKSHNNHPPGYTALAVKGPLDGLGKIETGKKDRVTNMMAFTAQLLHLFFTTLQKHHKTGPSNGSP